MVKNLKESAGRSSTVLLVYACEYESSGRRLPAMKIKCLPANRTPPLEEDGPS